MIICKSGLGDLNEVAVMTGEESQGHLQIICLPSLSSTSKMTKEVFEFELGEFINVVREKITDSSTGIFGDFCHYLNARSTQQRSCIGESSK